MHNDLKIMLQEWPPLAVSAGEIRRAVWQRSERDELSVRHGFVASLAAWFEGPMIAASVVAAAMTAGILKCSVKAVEARLYRARHLLRKQLDRWL